MPDGPSAALRTGVGAASAVLSKTVLVLS
jgi:hypothetical protein